MGWWKKARRLDSGRFAKRIGLAWPASPSLPLFRKKMETEKFICLVDKITAGKLPRPESSVDFIAIVLLCLFPDASSEVRSYVARCLVEALNVLRTAEAEWKN